MNKKEELEQLKAKMKADATLPLKKVATQLVFGVGDPNSEVICIGEGPGYYEDQKGEPFVGNAGAFLNQLLAIAGYQRGDVFITNVVHHRPPQNRDPEPAEIAAYQPYLDEMINIIDPKIIITLGRFSMGKFLADVRITKVHGKKYTVNWKDKELSVIPMYHPAAGLRNPNVKQQTVEDFMNLPELIKESKKEEEKKEAEQMTLV